MDVKLYQEELMEHFRHPRNAGELSSPDFAAEDDNPTCGDRVSIQGKIENGCITALRFSGKGCVISQATTSILTEHCTGKTVQEVAALSTDEVLALVGLPLGPNRLKCALLSRDVLLAGIAQLSS